MTVAIDVSGLRKTYRSRGRPHQALDGLDLVVGTGQIHGFLGQNGSGKTTTLRALLGLVRADGGTMRLFGQPVPAALPDVIGQVGAIVESPRFFGGFTGRVTLDLLATAGRIPATRIAEVLDLVGLRERADDRVRGYSLGMRQRLAVAVALLKSPRLLILDEPANGLDPGGVRDMRDLFNRLAATGTTVLLSSHVLQEVARLCDTVTIIDAGRRVLAGPVHEVLAHHGDGTVRVRVGALAFVAAVLERAGYTVDGFPDHLLVRGPAEPARVAATLAAADLYPTELAPVVPDLESVFLSMTRTESVR